MTDTITVRITEVNGEPLIDSQGLALLFGVTAADLRALPAVNGAATIPREWLRGGRRRAREAQAHTGSHDLADVLAYWARRDHNATVTFTHQGDKGFQP